MSQTMAETKPLTPAKIRTFLRKARTLAKKTHWTKGAYRDQRDDKTLYCTVGLINHVVGNEDESTESCQLIEALDVWEIDKREPYDWDDLWAGQVARAFAEANGINPTEIEDWNDEDERTKEEVIEAFTRAIENVK